MTNQAIVDRVEEALVGIIPIDLREKILDDVNSRLSDEREDPSEED